MRLGSSYLQTGDDDRAFAAFSKALDLDLGAQMYNEIAYKLAEADKKLTLALEYAEKAVRAEEEASQQVKLSELQRKDLIYTSNLAMFWDTLGWVHFRLGNYEKAETYLNSAWTVSEGPTEADHLGQVYEKQRKNQAAIHAYQLALAVSTGKPGVADNLPETRARLEHLHPGGSTFSALYTATNELSTMRTFKVAGLRKKSGSAEFFLLFGPGSKVEDVKFISGSDELKSAAKVFSSIPFKAMFPDDGPTRLLRRAMIACSPVSGCNLVLFTPDSVRSVN
jgi:hypothetical protein